MITIGSNTKIKNSIIGCNRSKKEKDLIKQIDQLTNNWNELEEYIKQEMKLWDRDAYLTYKEVLDKMKEIKENK